MSCTAFTYAVTAGAASACGTISSKFAFGGVSTDSQTQCKYVCTTLFALSMYKKVLVRSYKVIYYSPVCFTHTAVTMLGTGGFQTFVVAIFIFVLSYVLMWCAHTKSLSLADSTIQCLAINIGTNFALTGILGCVLFSESHSMFWCIGLGLVFIGVCLLASDEKLKTD